VHSIGITELHLSMIFFMLIQIVIFLAFSCLILFLLSFITVYRNINFCVLQKKVGLKQLSE